MVEQDITIHQGWLELYSDSSSGAWGKLSGKKQWKRRFIVFNQSASNEDECYLLSYEKEEAWRVAIPKRKLSLYPRYKVCKLNDFKGREKVLEVNNEQEKWYFASDKMKLINLWACQIQMQTKLSRSISGRIFSVVGASVKDMHNIGAAQQRCLLHFTKWGITLALQQSRAILAMWPIKTIRNYEDSGHSEFTIEAGRRAPMGEGVYKFETNAGQDREMFNVVDAFVAALLDEKARIAGASKQTTDDDILKIYDQLYKTAIGENQPHPQPPQPMNQRPKFHNQDMHDTPGYSHIGMNSATLSTKTSADNMSHVPMYKPPDYDNLYGEGVDFSRVQLDDEKKHSTGSYGDYSPRDLSFTEQNYDKLGGRNPSWGGSSDGGKGEYDHINSNTIGRKVDNTYDQIDRTGTSFKKKQGSWGTAGYPLRDEPSVPCLDDYDHSFKGRSPIQQTPENEKGFIFRNSIYSPLDSSSRKNSSASTIQGIGSRHDSTASEGGRPMGASAQGMDIRHDSTASESGRQFRRGISIKERSHQDIADHFMYQVPSSLNSTTDQETSFQQEEVYQNTQGTTPDETYSNTSSSQNTNSERSTTA